MVVLELVPGSSWLYWSWYLTHHGCTGVGARLIMVVLQLVPIMVVLELVPGSSRLYWSWCQAHHGCTGVGTWLIMVVLELVPGSSWLY